jgi:hypothetical protein
MADDVADGNYGRTASGRATEKQAKLFLVVLRKAAAQQAAEKAAEQGGKDASDRAKWQAEAAAREAAWGSIDADRAAAASGGFPPAPVSSAGEWSSVWLDNQTIRACFWIHTTQRSWGWTKTGPSAPWVFTAPKSSGDCGDSVGWCGWSGD